MDFLEFLNPLRILFPRGIPVLLADTLRHRPPGILGEALRRLFLFLAFWFGVRRQRFQIGFAYFVISVAMTYGATVLRFLGFR